VRADGRTGTPVLGSGTPHGVEWST